MRTGPHAAFDRALIDHQAGRLVQAEAGYRAVLAVLPDHRDALHLLGVAAYQCGRNDEAIVLIGRALAFDDGVAAYHHNLAEVLRGTGRHEQAVRHYRRAVALSPDWASAHTHLGVALHELGRLDEAVVCYRRGLALDEGDAAAHNNLGVALQERGALAEAEASYRRALALAPGDVDGGGNLANLLREQGRPQEAVVCYRQVLAARPDLADVHSNLLFTLLGLPDARLPEIAAAAAGWSAAHAAGLRAHWPDHRSKPPRPRRPRLGFVSGDFRRHAVGFLTIRALEALAAAGQGFVCYSNGVVEDVLTDRFKRAAVLWRPICGRSDAEVAQMIRNDGVDILFDLSGHTALNRLPLFAAKPAPIQVSWVGYPGTTGLEAMDYLLADGHQVPPSADSWYQERIIRLPAGYICWEPPAEAPPVTSLPAAGGGIITFGSFNFLSKVSEEAVELWSRVLQAVPRSRLLLKAVGFACLDTRDRFRAMFAGHGIGPDRLTFAGGTSRADHLAAIGQVDIALDSFPYAGGLTTLETLWMGVPVVTYPADTLCSRHSLGYLTVVGLSSMAATDAEMYVRIAAGLASDIQRLSELRAGLRDRLLASPLLDGEGFARDLLAACGLIWDRWRVGLPPVALSL